MSKYLKLFETTPEYEAYINGGGVVLPNVSVAKDDLTKVYYNPYDPYNGHAYVDLGLPSGTKWATMNVGATTETDYGLYFAWGETQGYSTDQVGSGEGKKAFRWDDYKWTEDGGATFTKYNSTDGKTVLDLEDDAASVNWGGQWRMPTEAEYNELLNVEYVTNKWVTNYNGSSVNGRLFTSVNNGNTMFIPTAGSIIDGGLRGAGGGGNVWASALSSRVVKIALFFYIDNGTQGVAYDSRYYGQSVRGVVG